MTIQDLFLRLSNPFIIALLRSPFHALAGPNTLLISVTGRRSGRTYATPVNYHADGSRLTIISLRQRTWWRNLREGAEVGLRLQGRDRRGLAGVVEDDAAVARALAETIRRTPAYARFFGVTLGPDSMPDPELLARAARQRVIVNVQVK